MSIKKPKTKKEALAQRTAKVRKETAGDGPSSYVVRVYDTHGCLDDFFDSSTLNPQAALEFVLLATRNSKVERVEFGEECKEIATLWKYNLRHGSIKPVPH